MSGEFVIRKADIRDAAQLGVIGPASYAEAYSHMWADAEAYARQLATFGSDAMIAFMSRPEAAVWVAEQNSRVVGFLTLLVGSPDPIEHRSGGAEIPRIYLLAPARGKGLARRLLAESEDHARSRGASYLWLDALREARWAWKAYEKLGFSQIGEGTFEKGIASGFEAMVVLRRSLS